MDQTFDEKVILRDLGDGLVLRRGVPTDADALADLNEQVHGNPHTNERDARIGVWTRDLLTLPHPTFSPGDFTLVEDTATGALVSTCNHISQTWSYAGIPFKVGRPELVGTLGEYRRKGLVRAQFEVLHDWSVERGEMVQAITGIPYYYRQFGYEMTMELDGGRVGYQPHLPKLADGQEEPYRIRPATEADLPFIAALYEETQKRYLVSALRDVAMWRYELTGRSAKSVVHREMLVIETGEGEAVGFLTHPTNLWGVTLAASGYEVKAGVPWSAVTPSVVRYLWATGERYAAEAGGEPLGGFALALGGEHPAYEVSGNDLMPRVWEPYAWYMRVPDVAAFLRHIAPVLDARLATSAMAGYSGEFKISFYRDGVRLLFENGKLQDVQAWKPMHGDSGAAQFPDQTFLHLLFGHRTLDEVHHVYVDCRANGDEARTLVMALFPKQASSVWPIN